MMGRAAAFDTNGRFDLEVEDSTANNAVNAHVGQHLYFTGSNGGRFNLPISSNTATRFVVNNIESQSWFFNGFPWRVALPGTRYVLTNSSNEATVVATVTPALTPGALDGRWVHANDSMSNTTGAAEDF